MAKKWQFFALATRLKTPLYGKNMSPILITAHSAKAVFSRIDFSSIKLPLTLSLMNQLVSSGGNFLLGVYLARTLTLESFGMYGLGYGICMLYIGVGNAMILTQMVVNMPDREDHEKDAYAAKMLCAVLLLGAIILAVVSSVMGVVVLVAPVYRQFLPPVFAVALASALFLCNEFFISYAYLKRKEKMALMVNAITMLILFTGLAVENKVGIALNAENVLLLYALGAAIAAFIAYVCSPLKLRHGIKNFVPDLLESWRHGRWALGGVIVTWIQGQTYTYVLAFSLGAAGVGLANAARIFISPFSFLVPAINKIAMPRLADLRQQQRRAMFRTSMMITAGMSLLTVIYSVLLLSSLGFISNLVLGRHDARIESLVWVWCLLLIFQMVRSGGSLLMQVQRKFRVLTLMSIPCAVITVIVALVMIRLLGATGAILGVVAGELALALFIWREIRYDKAHGN